MKIKTDRRLFWFLKEGASLDLGDPSTREMYVQQVLSGGRTQDIKILLKRIPSDQLKGTFQKVKPFLSQEVRSF